MIDFLLYIFAGIAAGFLSGLLGIGGGLVMVPILAFVYHAQEMPNDIIMHLAAGTSFATMLVTTTVSTRAHKKRGADIWITYKKLFVGIILGTIAGAILADYLHSNSIRTIFGIFALLMAIKILLPEKKLKTASPHLPKPWVTQLTSFAIGVPSGLLGIGSSASLIPFLTHLGFSMRNAIGVSSASSFTIALIGTFTLIITGANEPHTLTWATGYVYWPAVLGIVLVSPFFALLGTRLSHHVSTKKLKLFFTIFLIGVATHMLYH